MQNNQNIKYPIRVLHIVTHMNCGGLETMIMNYYRVIDRSKIQFDLLTHCDEKIEKFYDKEIYQLGGRIYYLPRLSPLNRFEYNNKITNKII